MQEDASQTKRRQGGKVLQQDAKYGGHHAHVGATSAGRPDSPTTKHGLPADIALSEAAASHVAAARRLLAKGSTCESSTCAALQPTGSSLRQSGSDCLAQRLDRWPTMLRGQAVRRASTGDAHERVVPLVLGAAGGPCRRLVCEAFSCIRRSSDGPPPPLLRISTGRQPLRHVPGPFSYALAEKLCATRAAAFARMLLPLPMRAAGGVKPICMMDVALLAPKPLCRLAPRIRAP